MDKFEKLWLLLQESNLLSGAITDIPFDDLWAEPLKSTIQLYSDLVKLIKESE